MDETNVTDETDVLADWVKVVVVFAVLLVAIFVMSVVFYSLGVDPPEVGPLPWMVK